MEKQYRNSWTGAHEYFIHRSMMEEHRLRSQRSKHGGRDMISQHERISNRHLTQKQNELLRYFGNNVFKIYIICKVLHDCKEL
jgi:hypothetical protein